MRGNVRILTALAVAVAAAGTPRAWAQVAPAPAPAPAPAAGGQDQGQGPNPAQGQGQGQVQGQAAAVAPVDPNKLNELLGRWEQNSSRLKTLDIEMTRTDQSPAWGEDEHYLGRAILKSPNLAFLDFRKEVEAADPKTGAKKKGFVSHERIICTGDEVWQYRNDTKQIFIYPLEKDVQQRALEEGPLPFLFNFKAVDAQKRYQMALVSEDEKSYVIRIIPKLEIDRESFTKAWVVLDRKNYLLPARIFLVAPDGKSTKDFVLTKQSPNAPVMDENFKGKPYEGWNLVRNPGGDGPPAAAPAPAPAAAPRPAQPAQAPAIGARPGAETPSRQPASRSRLFGGRRN